MKVGDLVSIYYMPLETAVRINKVGVITEMVGYKTTVLISGRLEPWDIFDLEAMRRRKAEHESR